MNSNILILFLITWFLDFLIVNGTIYTNVNNTAVRVIIFGVIIILNIVTFIAAFKATFFRRK